VRDRIQADTGNDDEGMLDAAKQCAAERDADPTAFEEEYSTDDPGRTAFEECVAEHADDNDQTDPGDGTDEPGTPGDDQGGDVPTQQ
jgi:hypothetical protein